MKQFVKTYGAHLAVIAGVAVALAAGTTVSLGVHRPWVTLPLAAVLGWLMWKAVRPRNWSVGPGPQVAHRRVLQWIGVWTLAGCVLAGHFLIVSRDPGFLTLTGVWLTDHSSTDIPTLGTIDAAAAQSNMLADAWQAWNLNGDSIQPQGAKMLPAFLSVGGWLGGTIGVQVMNSVIGGLGLVAVYLLARKLVAPLPAALAATMLSLTAAHSALSRSAYSEPLTLLLLVAAMLWAWQGVAERRIGSLAVAGLVSGATALVRIDGAAYAVGLLLGVAVALALRGVWGARAFAAFTIPQVLAIAAGYASLWRWSRAYLERLGSEAAQVNLAYGAVALAALVIVPLVAMVISRREHGLPRARVKSALVFAGTTFTALALLASRPLWYTDRRGTENSDDRFTNSVVESFQKLQGLELDPTRTYAESTVNWLSYYVTWPVLAVAAVGFALMAFRAARGQAALWPVLGAIAAPTLLYLVRPAIVPDQIWAIRRFEPVTLPGIVIAAAVGGVWIVHLITTYRPHWQPQASKWAVGLALLAPVITYISIVPSADRWFSVVPAGLVPEQYGARDLADELCATIDGRPVVLYGSSGTFGTIRVMCDVPVVLALVEPEQDALAQMREVLGEDLMVLTQESDFIAGAEPFAQVTVLRSEYALQRLPRGMSESHNAWFAGNVNQDGTLTALATESASP